jgi:translation initiation factor IF-3
LKREQYNNKFLKRNQEIRVPFVTLINENGEKTENCPTQEALNIAREQELDLVLVAPNVQPPVAKIMDWGKYKYELSKKAEQNKKLSKIADLKEVRLRPKTDHHDLEIKMKKIRDFIEKGHKVKMVMVFRGREVAFLERGKNAFHELIGKVSDIARIEDKISFQFKRLSVTLMPHKSEQKVIDKENKNNQ